MFRVVFLSLLMAFFSYNSFAQYSEHIVILWDVTGSLLPQKKGEKDYNGDPLPAYSKGNGMWKELKKAVIDCIEFVEEDPSNKISVVTFHDHVRDVFSRNASLNGKKDLVNFVTNYKYQGHKYTNIVEPIKRFYNLLDDKKVNYMFLFTDGDNDAPTRPQFIPTLDSWNRLTEGFNAYGFYVLVHPNADKPNIRTSVESQDNFWIVPDAKVRIKICSLPTTIKYNLRDDKGPKKINMGGKYAGAKGEVQLTTQDQFYDIVSNPTPYDDYFTVTYWKNDNYSDKDICWAREIVDNATGKLYGISVLEYTSDAPDEDLGIIRLIIYPIECEDDFDIWWNEIEEDNRPNGLIIYQAE
jgi:hypothetical protein